MSLNRVRGDAVSPLSCAEVAAQIRRGLRRKVAVAPVSFVCRPWPVYTGTANFRFGDWVIDFTVEQGALVACVRATPPGGSARALTTWLDESATAPRTPLDDLERDERVRLEAILASVVLDPTPLSRTGATHRADDAARADFGNAPLSFSDGSQPG
jgi:hypothetical protein